MDSSVKVVSQENCFTQYIYAQGHNLIDVLSGHDLSGEVILHFIVSSPVHMWDMSRLYDSAPQFVYG